MSLLVLLVNIGANEGAMSVGHLREIDRIL